MCGAVLASLALGAVSGAAAAAPGGAAGARTYQVAAEGAALSVQEVPATGPGDLWLVAVHGSGVVPGSALLDVASAYSRAGINVAVYDKRGSTMWQAIAAVPWRSSGASPGRVLYLNARDSHYDPTADWRAAGVPVMAWYGAQDRSVQPDRNAPRLRSALQDPRSVVLVADGADHGMHRTRTGFTFQERPGPIEDRYVSSAASWIRSVDGGTRWDDSFGTRVGSGAAGDGPATPSLVGVVLTALVAGVLLTVERGDPRRHRPLLAAAAVAVVHAVVWLA